MLLVDHRGYILARSIYDVRLLFKDTGGGLYSYGSILVYTSV